jgi:hypothetical protein
MDTSRLQRLLDLGFQMIPLPNVSNHFALERDGFVALVRVRGDEMGETGAPGLLTESGFAALVWRGAEAWFAGRGYERRAEAEEVEAIRRFGRDLKSA